MKNTVENIVSIFISILLMASSIWIMGTTSYYKYIQIAVFAIFIAYSCFRIFKNRPIKLIKNKLDVCVALLVLATAIPLIFNSYVSLYGVIQDIILYLFAFCIYILIREIKGNIKWGNKIIVNTLIFSCIVLIFIGLDGITFNFLKDILKNIGIVLSENGDSRLVSTFGCATAFGVYLASVLFLNFNEAIYFKKTPIKAIYKTVTLILFIGIILTYSKGVFVVLIPAIILYIILLKDKMQKIEIIENVFISIVETIVFIKAFDSLFNIGSFVVLWTVFAIVIISSYIINLLAEKINNYIKNVNLKKIGLGIAVLLIIIAIYTAIGLFMYDKYEVFNNNIVSDYKVKVINNIEANTEYLLEFNIDAYTSEDEKKPYAIKVIQKNIKNQEIESKEIHFGNYNGIQNIELQTNPETTELRIEFTIDEKCTDRKLVINELKINNKKIALQYKYLPTKLVEKIKNINIKYKTLQERKEMVVNAIELSKENFITGIGGNGWQYKYKDVQTYNYTARKIHSYPAKILLEYGLIGIIAYFGILTIITTETIKNKNSKGIILAVIVLLIHSIMDTDMEYAHILIYTFGLLGAISSSTECKKENKILSTITTLVLIVVMSIGIYELVNIKKYDGYEKVAELLRNRNGLRKTSDEYLEINKQIAQNYEKILLREIYNYIPMYETIVKYYLNSNYENKQEKLEEYYEKIAQYQQYSKINNISRKIKTADNIVKLLGKYDKSEYNDIRYKFIKLIINEYEETKTNIKENLQKYNTNSLRQELEELEKIYDYATTIKELYLLGVRAINQSDIKINEQELEKIKPKISKNIIIYHTHGTESYKSDEPYETYKFYRTTDSNYNVIKMGNYLAELLEERGYKTIHDTQYFDMPVTEGAYTKSKAMIQKLLNDEINTIIDVHRDAISEEEHQASTVEIEGKNVANLRFVVGINPQDDDWMNHLKLVIDIQKIADKKYPGLFKPIIIRNSIYNQDIVENAILIEIGENCNTIEEATRATKYFAEVLCTNNES